MYRWKTQTLNLTIPGCGHMSPAKKQEILMVAEVLFYLQKMKSLGGPLPSTDHGNDLKYTEFHSMILDIVCAHFESSLPFYMLYQVL